MAYLFRMDTSNAWKRDANRASFLVIIPLLGSVAAKTAWTVNSIKRPTTTGPHFQTRKWNVKLVNVRWVWHRWWRMKKSTFNSGLKTLVTKTCDLHQLFWWYGQKRNDLTSDIHDIYISVIINYSDRMVRFWCIIQRKIFSNTLQSYIIT